MKAFAKNGAKNDESIGGGFGLLNGGAPRALAPLWIFYPLVFISLALPNLIYSGADWFDTLHIMKWAWTMVPVALVSLIGGSMLALFGAERTGFRLDLFGAVWLGLLAFVSLQPFWCDIFAWSTYFKEWFFLASLLAAYIFCYNLFGSQAALRRVLWLANLNAAVNVVFAELLIRDMNDICPLIMNVPGNYIGNTGQQEMFGLWMAMAAMNGIYLHMVYSSPLCGCARRRLPMWANLFLLAFNSWGLWNSTTRAGMVALFTGTAALALTARNCREDGRALASSAEALLGGFAQMPLERTNTTISCVVTNARLTKAQATKVAQMAADAYAHAITPTHTTNDGDTVFVMATGEVDAPVDVVGALATRALGRAIVDGARQAVSAYGYPAARDL